MLAVLPAARAAAVEPGLSPAWTGLHLLISADTSQAALADALHEAAAHRCPLVIDCPDRNTAAAVLGVLARLAAAADLAVAVAVHPAPDGCQLRAVLPQLSERRWWPFWATRTARAAL
jgi:hypothetical protein